MTTPRARNCSSSTQVVSRLHAALSPSPALTLSLCTHTVFDFLNRRSSILAQPGSANKVRQLMHDDCQPSTRSHTHYIDPGAARSWRSLAAPAAVAVGQFIQGAGRRQPLYLSITAKQLVESLLATGRVIVCKSLGPAAPAVFCPRPRSAAAAGPRASRADSALFTQIVLSD